MEGEEGLKTFSFLHISLCFELPSSSNARAFDEKQSENGEGQGRGKDKDKGKKEGELRHA